MCFGNPGYTYDTTKFDRFLKENHSDLPGWIALSMVSAMMRGSVDRE